MGSCCSRADAAESGGDYVRLKQSSVHNEFTASLLSDEQKLSPEELEQRRKQQAEAAEKRAKKFQQGGGGEKLKAKSKALEEAEAKNAGEKPLKWTV